ncbi:MAG: hypothetical protein NZ455_14845 [Bacteroidia bacterium]|nr:hypothetical protein [Bacteroidia bacterium]MDW8345925.1 hypothetical protein [Bacteroidia bacterium]
MGRSTEAQRSPQHADPSVARDTPKKENLNTSTSNYLQYSSRIVKNPLQYRIMH